MMTTLNQGTLCWKQVPHFLNWNQQPTAISQQSSPFPLFFRIPYSLMLNLKCHSRLMNTFVNFAPLVHMLTVIMQIILKHTTIISILCFSVLIIRSKCKKWKADPLTALSTLWFLVFWRQLLTLPTTRWHFYTTPLLVTRWLLYSWFSGSDNTPLLWYMEKPKHS